MTSQPSSALHTFHPDLGGEDIARLVATFYGRARRDRNDAAQRMTAAAG